MSGLLATDRYDPGAGQHDVVLLWHGSGPRERSVLRPLAEALAKAGSLVLVPDWDSGAQDRGASVLRTSLDRAVEVAGGLPLVIVGWSLGGTAALTVAVAGGPATAVVGLAAAPRARSPLGGGAPLRALATAESVVPIRLVHGTADPVVPADRSVEFAHACRAAGLPCELRLVDTDHAGIVGTEYDPERGHCVPSTSDAARRGLAAAVAAVAELRDS